MHPAKKLHHIFPLKPLCRVRTLLLPLPRFQARPRPNHPLLLSYSHSAHSSASLSALHLSVSSPDFYVLLLLCGTLSVPTRQVSTFYHTPPQFSTLFFFIFVRFHQFFVHSHEFRPFATNSFTFLCKFTSLSPPYHPHFRLICVFCVHFIPRCTSKTIQTKCFAHFCLPTTYTLKKRT
jgi:hypothetical protein